MRRIRHRLYFGILTTATSVLCTFASATGLFAQQKSPGTLLREGTVITLDLFDHLKSNEVQTGAIVELSVYKPIVIEGKTLIKDGAYGEARVINARRAGVFGRPGKLEVEAISVEAVDGTRIKLRGGTVTRIGRDRRGLATALLVFGFLVRGDDVEMESKTKFRALVESDVLIQD